jgi:ribonuclease Z
MDHFCGFDKLLRLFLGRKKTLDVFGPPGFLGNMTGKLSSYTWNLAHTFDSELRLQVTEIHENECRTGELSSRNGFRLVEHSRVKPFDGVLLAEPSVHIQAALLDHGTPCLAFALRERFHVNVMKTALDHLGLPTGSWLRELKEALYSEKPQDTRIEIPLAGDGARSRCMTVGELAPAVTRISSGQSLAYVTDVAYTDANRAAILSLIRKVDHLFIEAAFLHEDRSIAAGKHHLTAVQAGRLAADAEVDGLTVFHFSPRYEDRGEELVAEANAAYRRRLSRDTL